MKVFVYEYCCSQPLRGDKTARALRDEGVAMLSAIVIDLTLVPGVEPIALLANDLPSVAFPCRRVRPAAEKRTFRRLAKEADYTLVIAPEIDGILEERCRWVLDAGGRLLGPSPEAVKLTGDKYALHQHLVAHALPTPQAELVANLGPKVPRSFFPGVCKPRDGAGSLHTRLVKSTQELNRFCNSHPETQFLLQPFVRGTPASVALLIGPRHKVPLRPCGQTLSADGKFTYLGGWNPLEPPLARRARKLALAAVKCVPGLLGYVGVDLVLGTQADGSGDRIIEINPRLTTSYLGLRFTARNNLAGALLNVVQGRPVRFSWYRQLIHWAFDDLRWTFDDHGAALEA
jgi:predicted ATP-grasp superfamily ATP-dependent carboligase